MNLQEQGFRFLCRGDRFKWFHPLDKEPGDIDCTDISNDDLEKLIRERIPQSTDAGVAA